MTDTQTDPVTLPISRRCPFDPPAELAELREQRPITRLSYPDGHVGWLVTGHALARSVLGDPRFSSRLELRRSPIPVPLNQGAPETREVGAGMFIGMDRPEHTRYRKLLTGQFTVRRMKQLEPRIAEITADRLDAMQRAGSPVDLVSMFALPIPSLVICELLGVPYENRERFQANTTVLLKLEADPQDAAAAWNDIRQFLHELVRHKRSELADDLLSGLIALGELDDDELTGIALLLLIAGHETTANMLGLGTFALLSHPEQLAALRARPELVDGAVEELMRYLTIIQFGPVRAALEDVELGGETVRAGDVVTLSAAAANRDPERFDDPDTLDLTRSASGHLGFGHGVHQCLGQQLARIEMRIGYRALFERFPDLRLAVPAAEVPLRDDMRIYGVHALPVAWGED